MISDQLFRIGSGIFLSLPFIFCLFDAGSVDLGKTGSPATHDIQPLLSVGCD